MGERVNASEYARRTGKAITTVQRAISSGYFRRGDDGLIDAAEADAYWRTAKAAPPRGRQPDADGSAASAADHRERKMAADADLSELKAAEMAGTLVDRAAANAAFFAVGRELRNRVLSLPDRLANECVGKSAKQIRALWRDELAAAVALGDPPKMADAAA